MKWPSNYWKTYASGSLTAVIVLISAYLIYEYWSLLGAYESSSATLRNIAIVLAAVIGLPFAILRSLAALHSLADDRYQKSAEMLGSKILAVRISGVVGLWNVAHAVPRTHHLQTMRILCAFIRNWQDSELESIRQQDDWLTELLPWRMAREDVQEIMDSIGGRSSKQLTVERKFNYRLELYKADLSHIMLVGGNLSGAHLWQTNLSGAVLRDADLSNTHLAHAILSDTDLTGANLSGAEGLTASQLARAKAERGKPPILTGVKDCSTGKALVWCGKNSS